MVEPVLYHNYAVYLIAIASVILPASGGDFAGIACRIFLKADDFLLPREAKTKETRTQAILTVTRIAQSYDRLNYLPHENIERGQGIRLFFRCWHSGAEILCVLWSDTMFVVVG